MPKGKSPTARTLEYLRELGYMAEVVEKWNPHARVRHDLFNIIDILGISATSKVVAIQATSYSNVSARVTKMQDDDHKEALRRCKNAGWYVLVWGWFKKDGHWTFREVVL